MNTYDNNNEQIGLNSADFLGNFLRKDDLDGETTVTLIAVRAEQMPNSTRRKLVAQFAEFEKPLILNSTNIKRLSEMFRSRNTADWRGAIRLYVDETIEYAGTRVGGIRLKLAVANGGGTSPQHSDGVEIL